MRTELALAVAALALAAAPASAQGSGSLGAMADELAAHVAAAANDERGDVAVVIRPALAEEVTRPAELCDRIIAPVLAALREAPRVGAVDRLDPAVLGTDAGRDADWAAVHGYALLVRVAVSVEGAFLRVDGSIFRAARAGWLDVFRPSPALLSELSLRRRLDAHLRYFVGALPRVTDRTIVARAAALPSRDYVAMAISDVDGNGRPEVVLIRTDTIEVVRIEPGRQAGLRASRVGSAPMADIPAAPSKARRPIGTAFAVDGSVVARTSQMAAPVAIRITDGRLSVVRTVGPCADDAFALPDACASWVTGRDYFHSDLLGRGTEPAPPPAPSGFYARAARSVVQQDGSEVAVEAVVTPRGRLGVRVGEQRAGAVGYGAALGMADLDDDGLVELVTSAPTPVGSGDHLSVLRVRANGGVIAVWTSEELAGSVMVAGGGDVDGDGLEELLAIEEPAPGTARPAFLWVIR